MDVDVYDSGTPGWFGLGISVVGFDNPKNSTLNPCTFESLLTVIVLSELTPDGLKAISMV